MGFYLRFENQTWMRASGRPIFTARRSRAKTLRVGKEVFGQQSNCKKAQRRDLLRIVSSLEFLLQAVDLVVRERSTVALQFPLEPQSRLIIVGVDGRVGVGIFSLATGNISIRLRFCLLRRRRWRRRRGKKELKQTQLIQFRCLSLFRYDVDDYAANCSAKTRTREGVERRVAWASESRSRDESLMKV